MLFSYEWIMLACSSKPKGIDAIILDMQALYCPGKL